MARRRKRAQKLDEIDRRILDLIQRDAALPQAAIGRHVGLSTAAVNERLHKLRASGTIRRVAALVDPAALGASVTAFVEVFLDHARYEPGFIQRVVRLPAVQECHHITGEFSVLLKVRVRDMESLQRLVISQLNGLQGVRQTRTVMVLSTVKEESYVATGA